MPVLIHRGVIMARQREDMAVGGTSGNRPVDANTVRAGHLGVPHMVQLHVAGEEGAEEVLQPLLAIGDLATR
ncbi:Protein of unknown function [Propionibacterium freudenreichii]|nr:Protein of unknown function [Propionibacterium freudenreichii]